MTKKVREPVVERTESGARQVCVRVRRRHTQDEYDRKQLQQGWMSRGRCAEIVHCSLHKGVNASWSPKIASL